MSFISELRRRNVIRVAVLYFVSSWLLLQLTDVLSSLLPVPEWTGSLVFLLLLIGLAPALIFAWVYEMTPEGIKRERDVDRSQSITTDTGRKINLVIAVLLVLAIAGMVADRLVPETVVIEATGDAVTKPDRTIDAASIAVLPFADMSEGGDQQYFTDGLTEELLNMLVRVDGLSVASRTSAFAYRGSLLGIPQIATELGVAHVLEGSVRKSGDRIRITAQLIAADSDRHLWSENFDRNLDDIFAIQDEIGTAIVNALKDELGIVEEISVGVEQATSNIGAYELYLEARELFIRRERIDESIRLFREAIALDPEFARAWEGLAAAESVADDWLFGDGIEHLPLALEAAEEALALDPDLSMPYAVLAFGETRIGGSYLGNIEYLDLAIEKDPKNSSAYLWRGISLNALGFFTDAIEDFETCLALDPGYINCKHHMAASYLYAGNEQRALEIYEPTLDQNFHSMSEAFVPVYAEHGQRVVALLLADIKFGLSSAPVVDWIEAILHPERDNSAGLARWRQWEASNAVNGTMDSIPIVFLPFAAYEAYAASTWSDLYLWHAQAAGFRSTDVFKAYIRDKGILAYWRAQGFPAFCHPVGADDFACGRPR